MFEYVHHTLSRAEIAAKRDPELGLRIVRELGLDDFGRFIISLPNADYPTLSALLPRMASEQVQKAWTGAAGVALLQQSASFVRIVSESFRRHTGKGLGEARILDFGCGYGRLLRLMMYYNPVELAGCDPWEESLKHCREAGLNCRLDRSDYVPQSLPYPPAHFDFIFSFSVFTHLSLAASRAAMSALRRVIKPDGALAITIRPVEYWSYASDIPVGEKPGLIREHGETGFAYRQHSKGANALPYGDTSMTTEFIRKEFPEWAIAETDASIHDAYQVVVILRPRD